MSDWRKFVRFGGAVVAAAALWRYSNSLLWLGALLLGIFFLAIDVFQIDSKGARALDMKQELRGAALGVLGRYRIDASAAYGLFIELLGWTVFVDIREDSLKAAREEHARFLFAHRLQLEESLKSFLASNPAYRERSPTYIGVHSDNIERCEVFWEPEGHTGLDGTKFIS